MGCMRIYKEHVDKAGMDQAYFQVNDRTVVRQRALSLKKRKTIHSKHLPVVRQHALRPSQLGSEQESVEY